MVNIESGGQGKKNISLLTGTDLSLSIKINISLTLFLKMGDFTFPYLYGL